MLRFYWNGIKDNGGKLQTCHYSIGQLINYSSGTITIYAREYARLSDGIREAFKVENDTDIQSDYIVQDVIRVEPTHTLYSEVFKAYQAQETHNAKLRSKRVRERLSGLPIGLQK